MKYWFIVAAAPVLLAAAPSSSTSVARSFAKTVINGEDLGPLLAAPLDDDTSKELAALSGCKVKSVEKISASRFGIQWRCPSSHAAMRTAAVVDVHDQKISQILMSTVRTERRIG
ncbi:hypothetical protein [Allopontixanthobacter sediminis]|uniref:Uncharacterized protein n=1 Tax=Allopontixanthobacter sediminis TaxID=1689985 RepID=A0A845AZX0_9SPHN|nr:hypothetical protein [Allopontixanthobacter sediminis]MXP43518.1 hypothetical protein [Allopontixanthobacter sediminis]